MTQVLKHIFYILTFLLISITIYCQEFIKETNEISDSTFGSYTWEIHDNYHFSFAKIILLTNGRFKYSSHRTLDLNEFSEGPYTINKDTLTLASDFQSDNMKFEINYIDSSAKDSSYVRLSFPKNQKGDILFNAYYFINNDTSINGHFDPMAPFNLNLLDSIQSLKVKFYDNGCGSMWMPIKQTNKFIQITLLTDKYFDDRRYKIIDQWKFKIDHKKLIKFTSDKQ